jgi:hypothetical protein
MLHVKDMTFKTKIKNILNVFFLNLMSYTSFEQNIFFQFSKKKKKTHFQKVKKI